LEERVKAHGRAAGTKRERKGLHNQAARTAAARRDHEYVCGNSNTATTLAMLVDHANLAVRRSSVGFPTAILVLEDSIFWLKNERLLAAAAAAAACIRAVGDIVLLGLELLFDPKIGHPGLPD
jgi:hypothetical protein